MVIIVLFFSVSLCRAQSDHSPSDLVRLIPPDAPVVAGMHRLPHGEQRDGLWLATKHNSDDLDRFITITEGDTQRRVDQVIAADWASPTDGLGNHLLIAQGRFSFTNVLSTASGLTRLVVDGAPVLAFEDSGTNMHGPLWLAMPRADFALFGAPSAVRYALARYRAGDPMDARMKERIKNAYYEDASWSSVRLNSRPRVSAVHLQETAVCLSEIRELDLGVRLGAKVRVEVRAGSLANGSVDAGGCLRRLFFGGNDSRAHFTVYGDDASRVRVSLDRGEYDHWLDSFRKSRVPETLEAMLSEPRDGGSETVPGVGDSVSPLR
jgi:hypothetical protein